MAWGSLLKKRAASEKEKVAEKWVWLNKMEDMLKQEEIAIGLLNTEAEELMEKVKELYAVAEARANANIKTQGDLNGQAIGLAQWEQMVTKWEEELQEKEEEVTDTLEFGCSEVSSHEADLNIREITLEADRTSLGDLCTEVLACELSAELEASQLAFRKELVDKEKRLAETQPQELAIARKRLEELQPAQAIEA
jgi:hypothetical protein